MKMTQIPLVSSYSFKVYFVPRYDYHILSVSFDKTMVVGMNIKGSPTSIELFGLQDAVGDSQDLFDDLPDIPVTTQQQFTTPSKKRPCFRSPHLSSGRKNDLISPLSAAISNSVQGIYCSQEVSTLLIVT